MPGGFAGCDKDGSPILVELFGYLDFKGMIYSAKKVDIEKTKLQLGETITQKLESQSKQVYTTLIFIARHIYIYIHISNHYFIGDYYHIDHERSLRKIILHI